VACESEHPAIQNKKISILFTIFVGVFALLVTNLATQINTDLANPDPNAKPW
jgi:hypothetical protein